MKNGTFIIFERNGKFIAAIRRDDGQVIELPEIAVTDDLQKLDGHLCRYLLKKDRVVCVGDRNILRQIRQDVPKPERKEQPAQIDWRKDLRQSTNNIEPITEERRITINDSFSPNHLQVPDDTKRNCEHFDGDNFALKLNKFGRFDFKDNKEHEKHFKFYKAQAITGKGHEKNKVVPLICICPNFGKLFSEQKPNQIADRIKSSAQSVFSETGQLLSSKFRPEWRFVTGLGGHSVYETGITLHHVYGIPYIPASSVKGVLRAWIIQSHSDFNNNEGLAINNEEFCEVFGCPAELSIEGKKYKSAYSEARKGNITFFDAMPMHKPTIEVDVMNPHYPKYYTGTEAPTDTQSPIPIFFLTVAKTTFQFLMATEKEGWNLNTKLFFGKTLDKWLIEALEEHGIGAKTAVGYGYFKTLS